MNRSGILVLLVSATCIAVLGCDNDPLKKVQVHGTLTFDGGPPPGEGRVIFSPLEIAEGLPVRPAAGKFKADGEYEAMSFRPGDGIVPGKYMIGVSCVDSSMLSGAPGNDEYKKASYVSEDFVPQEFIVEAGAGSMEFNLDVPKRDPGK